MFFNPMNKTLRAAAFLLLPVCSVPLSAAPDAASEKNIQLEVFAAGEAKGLNLLYKGKTYRAQLNADRILTVQPQSEGKDVGKPLQLYFSVAELEGGRGERLDLLKLEKKPKPAIQPKKIEMVGLCEDKVRFELEMVFSEDSVTVQGEMRKGGGRRQNVILGYSVRFPSTHTLPATATPDEIAKATEGSTLTLSGEKIPGQSAGFSQIVSSIHGVEKALASGSWGERKIVVEAATTRDAKRVGTFWNYASTALYKGGWAVGRAAVDKSPGGPLVIRIE